VPFGADVKGKKGIKIMELTFPRARSPGGKKLQIGNKTL